MANNSNPSDWFSARPPAPPDWNRPSFGPGRSWTFYVLATLFVLLVLGLIIWRFWPHHETGLDPNAKPRPVTARGNLSAAEKTTIQIFREASPSVVHVTTTTLERDTLNLDVQRVPQGTGSGFVWDKDGHIVTNYHVIQAAVEADAGAAQVTLADQSTWDVQWVRAYPDQDLAVLWIKAPASRLQPIMVGSSHDLQVGQDAFAIGNPFGLDHTLTKGIISALGREIDSVTHSTIHGVIQTDAPINPGNSGGPLLDSAGRLIGVNTAILSPSKGSAGIGFAIPVDEVNRVIPQLIAHGKVVHPDLGVQLADDELMDRLGLQGALILTVQPGSAAAKAGLRPTRRTASGGIRLGDVIVAIDGMPIKSKKDYYKEINKYRVGDRIKVSVLREGKEQNIEVTLAAGS
jgi:S1-C subfamily serine protease